MTVHVHVGSSRGVVALVGVAVKVVAAAQGWG